MGYRGKLREREEARRLRAEGYTLLDIARQLGVSKSSVSVWVRDVEFDNAQGRKLTGEDLAAMQPGLARLMPDVGARVWKLYYAAQAQNWPLAKFQLKEARKLMELGAITRPKYEENLGKFLEEHVKPMMAALEAEDLGCELVLQTVDDKLHHLAIMTHGVRVARVRRTDLAIGDIAGGVMLAHKASKEARVAVEAMIGESSAFKDIVIPAVVFTDPEVAWCGLTEAEARAKGIDVQIAKFPWGASGRALSFDRTDGLTKLIVDPETERVLGVGIVGHGAGELIAEGVVAVEMGATVRDLAECVHPPAGHARPLSPQRGTRTIGHGAALSLDRRRHRNRRIELSCA